MARGAEEAVGVVGMGFPADAGHGLALRHGVLAGRRGDESADSDDPRLPPLRLGASYYASDGAGAALASPASSSSSDAFLSTTSTPSGLLNPYGVWSPPRAPSEASEFGTAREYDTTDLFFGENWLYDDLLFHREPEISGKSGDGDEEDKFIVDPDVGEIGDDSSRRHERSKSNAEAYTSPPCSCCHGEMEHKNGREFARDSWSAVYGRYQIMDDLTEVLDECGADAHQFRRNVNDDATLKGGPLVDSRSGDDQEFDLSALEKELQVLSPYLSEDANAANNHRFNHDFRVNDELNIDLITDDKIVDDKEFLKDSYSVHPFPEISIPEDIYGMEDFGPADTNVQNAAHNIDEGPKTEIDLASSIFHQEYEEFELRIFHRKNRTGFEENKDFPIVVDSVVAGRYRITEYLGSAAFSRVVQAHDLRTGMDVCLKIIKNDKDFFDQSLDEIKLLKFVNKHDPADAHHILRLYDFFYYQEHLFIVTELLRANLYEFQKYNQESSDEVYFSLPRIQAIARQCLEALVYLHDLNIVHCDLKPENILMKSYSRCEVKVIDLGSSCFLTDNLSLYVQSRSYRAPEIILGLPYDQRIDIWSLGCIFAELYSGEVLFPNEAVSTILARMIGTIGPIDTQMLALGQETPKYFTEEYDLFHKNEETGQLEYLIPEKSSLRRHLRCPDSKFVDFLSCLLQINPRKRPTAREALRHRWFSHKYR
ncbi:serine/threonine-protein kinase pakD-like isoform X1 [Triticum urartu]|uniref:Protein kinase domain-containing protein n=1 Tax=Triticum urartu TaxID=4572 RepID=A0A8R7K2D5_TRIUA|nr:serine/threonine-protein kinase pakD-like isoform X1 [Triticum urartu]